MIFQNESKIFLESFPLDQPKGDVNSPNSELKCYIVWSLEKLEDVFIQATIYASKE
jgi:hypothetical protein